MIKRSSRARPLITGSQTTADHNFAHDDNRLTAPMRSMLLRLINAAGRRFVKNGFTLAAAWMKRLLLNKACERTGLDDYGDDSFREGLRVLFRSYEPEAEFSFVGRICVNSDTVRLLSNRLRLVADRRRHPGIAAEVIRRPLFITGLPRSGTTFLHALLAQDPAHRAPQVWEVMHPSPPPETGVLRHRPPHHHHGQATEVGSTS